MKKTLITAILFIFASVICIDAYYRCGGALIGYGTHSHYVLKKCGEPDSKTSRTETYTNKSGVPVYINVEEWIYEGYHGYYLIIIANGIVQSAEFIRD